MSAVVGANFLVTDAEVVSDFEVNLPIGQYKINPGTADTRGGATFDRAWVFNKAAEAAP